MKANEFTNEAVSGQLNNPNIPLFKNPVHQCDVDGYKIMGDSFAGKYAFGILDDKGVPMSYALVDPEVNGLHKLVELYTSPEYRGKNLAAIILMSLKGKLGVKLLLDADEVVSNDARNLILKMVANKKLHPTTLDGTPISYDDLKVMFSKFEKTDSIILEGITFMGWEKRYSKDEKLIRRIRLAGTENISRESYD